MNLVILIETRYMKDTRRKVRMDVPTLVALHRSLGGSVARTVVEVYESVLDLESSPERLPRPTQQMVSCLNAVNLYPA